MNPTMEDNEEGPEKVGCHCQKSLQKVCFSNEILTVSGCHDTIPRLGHDLKES